MKPEIRHLTTSEQEIVEQNIPLIYYVANKYKHIPEDVFQSILSRLHYRLCVCAQNFDPEKGNKISSYIVGCLKGEIKNYFRDESWIIRPPRPLREMSFSTAVDRLGEEASAAELRGENPQTIGSCAIPVPLHSISSSSREEDDYEIDIPSNENIEKDVTDRVGGLIIIKEVFLSLRIEERIILALQMKRKSIKEIESRFQISR
ncbi:MAG TPA: sigma factor, partial [Methylomirabilota bacterium]|nr:sigma factor [Methylomirabilota bacterium]